MDYSILYQIKIEIEDGIILLCYSNGPEDYEQEILDFMYEQHKDSQPDKSKYSIRNLSKQHDSIAEIVDPVHMRLAIKAIEYSENYQ